MNKLHRLFCAGVALAMYAGISPVLAADREPVAAAPAVAVAAGSAQMSDTDDQRHCYSQPGARQPAFDLRCPTR
mgnify:CR=1 FL=1